MKPTAPTSRAMFAPLVGLRPATEFALGCCFVGGAQTLTTGTGGDERLRAARRRPHADVWREVSKPFWRAWAQLVRSP
jgi:hypothetical protein